jgi:hypothetical protein
MHQDEDDDVEEEDEDDDWMDEDEDDDYSEEDVPAQAPPSKQVLETDVSASQHGRAVYVCHVICLRFMRLCVHVVCLIPP